MDAAHYLIRQVSIFKPKLIYENLYIILRKSKKILNINCNIALSSHF